MGIVRLYSKVRSVFLGVLPSSFMTFVNVTEKILYKIIFIIL